MGNYSSEKIRMPKQNDYNTTSWDLAHSNSETLEINYIITNNPTISASGPIRLHGNED